ncbi:arthrofactin-type cyclic lipopeptide synthetase A [Pseudomonas baetica]|uniref:Arthrofactin-type cyclic lipopeptide synthetase A n=1 Tax=Pseudomonas baetica TaxID=674054 RepID=A0ABX4Q8C2_9PSED|nr:non-ribosomal peptide synthetase [Pseudomonas baetica]PKA73026.1 arthrofactin-type cyclic lipopeptide synthetase A [Pseudomonas baetica]PTC19170.1 non-ribosomal peptide synthetase [Pseudomonas baetica]
MPPISAYAADTSSVSPATFPLTAAQLDIWLDQLSRGDSPLYNIGGYMELTGPLDPARMQAALSHLVSLHDAMRIELLPGAGADGLPRQRFAPSMPGPLMTWDVSGQSDPKAAARALIQERIDQTFALDGGPLYRFLLIRFDDDLHWFSILAHHLIVDGWGFAEMIKSLAAIYNALDADQKAPDTALSYVDFIEDDARYYQSPRYAQDRAYWLDKYRLLPEPLLVPRYQERFAGHAPSSQIVARTFPAVLHERMKQLGQGLGASAFHVLLAALHVYFSRTAQRDEWVLGMPILNRSGARFKSTVGLFTQVSAVRMGFGRDLTFAELVRAIRDELKENFRHQRFPLSEMNRALGLLREDRAQLFELTVSYELDDQEHIYGQARGHVVKVSNHQEAAPLAIYLRSNRFDEQAWLHIAYSPMYFEEGEVEAFAERLLSVVEQGLENPQLHVTEFGLLSPTETALLQQWNDTRVIYPQGLTIVQRFEARAAQQPQALAAVEEGQPLTYAELNRQANALAHRLLEHGVQPDDRVALVARRGLDTLVGLLATLKAGAGYVPIDPAHPAERLNYLLNDSAPVIVLTQSALRARLPKLDVPVIDLNLRDWPADNLANPRVAGLTPANLAYVIYTSGSTGLPKGVMVEHGTLGNLVDWHCDAFDLRAGQHTSSLAGFGFDAMAWEVWPALCVGATLHLAPATGGNEDIDALLDWWRAQPLDVSFLPTPIAEYAFGKQLDHPTLRTLLIGGDRLRQFNRQQSFEVINNYGPTEATVVATSGRIDAGQALHIGKPVSNTTVYLLDDRQRPVPMGITGELYVGGAGVARGYLNQPELTAARFLRDPFSREPQARMYRTGDLARWRADGNLDYLGRNDDQVKIRGVRIELGEIETALGSHDAVREAVVQVRDGQLLAWFIEHEPLDINSLHAHLKTRLTSAMLPSAYVRLTAWPMTANGKLDRKALPAPGPEALIRREYEAPQGAVEIALAQIWSELLQVERVGRHDHFFELGGHSLMAVMLIERMRQLDLSSDVRVLFSKPTLAALAASVGTGREVVVPQNRIASDCTRITPDLLTLVQLDQPTIDCVVATVPGGAANVQDIYPLAPLQEGILYHHITAAQGDPYLLQSRLAFDSIERVEAFAEALRRVMVRHDILRTAVVWEGLTTPVQVVWREAILPVQEVLLDPADGAIIDQLHARFDARRYRLDVSQAPMIRLVYARDPALDRVVGILLFHHLAMDHVALEVMRGEMQASLSGQVQPLAAPVPYRNYVAQARLGVSEQEHEAFFREMLADIDEPTLPFGLQEVQGDGRRIDEARQMLDEGLYQRLRTQARQAGVSVASLVHLAWARVLAATSGQEQVVFGTVLMGRMQGGAGADRALGVFINTLPLRIDVAAAVLHGVQATHARLTALLGHEHASLALAQRCSGVASPSPLFSALLNYRHTDPSELSDTSPHTWQGIETLANEERTNYPLTLSVDDLGSDLRLTARTVAQIGAQRICAYVHAALTGLVEALEQAPQRPLNRLPILPVDELQRLLVEFNASEVACPLEQPLQMLFEQQVRLKPNAIALQSEQGDLTYGELNARANRLAHHLREQGVQPDTRVAICVERGLDLVVGLLGILKAGGAYVPLDPDYPLERLRYMLQDSAPVAVLVHAATRELLGEHDVPLIDLDRGSWQYNGESNLQVPGLSASNLAYMIYTSGSTGTPKGVMLEHRGLCNLVHWGSQICPPTSDSALLQKAPFSFDGSVWEFFWPLASGVRLVLARPDGHRDPAYLTQEIRDRQISVIKFVPALLQQFLEQDDAGQCTSLTDIFCGGGEFTAALAQRARQLLPWVRLHNVYGPTEATVDSTAYTLEPHMPVPAIELPIGKAIGNTRLYVLDEHDQPVPLGVNGQLHIGGVGVARGYLGLPQLQAERFIDSPFVAGDRLYRTGDLVRYAADGNLQFLGRNDFQIKLRGLRLEPGEIEARLIEHPAVREAVVMVRDERLVAWYTVRAGIEAPSLEALRAQILAHLPEYMVPAAFVLLGALPLTPNGKIDRKALPEPGAEAVLNRPYQPPEGDVETELARIWAEVLNVNQVGRHDNFFELGGHSLLAVSLVARMRQTGLHTDARSLFSQPTLAALAANTRSQAQHLEIPQTTIPSLNRKRRL